MLAHEITDDLAHSHGGQYDGAMIGIACLALFLAPSADAPFQALVEREWERQLARNPIWASLLGERRFASRWDDVRPAALAREAETDRRVQGELDAIDTSALSAPNRSTTNCCAAPTPTRWRLTRRAPTCSG